jgi:hypothetical protein
MSFELLPFLLGFVVGLVLAFLVTSILLDRSLR